MNYTYIILYSLLLANFNFLSGQYDLKKISEEMVFNKPPFQECHASTILEINQNEILVAAFGGTKEGKKDVSIWLTRKKNSVWQTPIIVDTGKSDYITEYPCWNPVLFKSISGKITLFYKLGPSPREWWGMEKNSIDLYATVRSLYLQDRKKKINNSSSSTEAMEDGDWDTLENQ